MISCSACGCRTLRLFPQPVIGRVVDAAEREGGPQVVGLGGVVVDDVEYDLDAGRMQRPDHRLELGDLAVRPGCGGVAVVRGQEGDRVVTPVIRQAAVREPSLGHELVHRHQLDRGDAQPRQVLDHGRMGQPGVGAALPRRHQRMAQREAAHVRLVDEGLVIRGPRRLVVAPVERRVDDHVPRHVRGAVRGADGRAVVHPVGVQRLMPAQLALDGLAVRVEQELRRIAPVPQFRLVGTVYPVAVPLAGPDSRQVAMPDEAIHLGQRDPGLRAPGRGLAVARLGQAQLDGRRHLGEQGEIGA